METNSKDNNKLLKSYAIWLKNQGIKSANVFTSGISKVNEEFFMPVCHKDMFEELPRAIGRCEAVDWLTSLESFINLAFEKTIVRKDKDENGNAVGPIVKVLDITEKKKLENRRNCLRKFIEFVAILQEVSNGLSDEDFLRVSNSNVFFDKAKLERKTPIFYNFFDEKAEIFFMPSLLKRLFEFFSQKENLEWLKKKNLNWGDNRDLTPIERFNEWRLSVLQSTKFYSANKTFTFDQIEGLTVNKDDQSVYYISNGRRYEAVCPFPSSAYYPSNKYQLFVEPRIKLYSLLKKHSFAFPIFLNLTLMMKMSVRGVEINVADRGSQGKTRTVRLYEFKKEDGMHLINYLYHALPKKKLWSYLPHILLELNQLVAYTPHFFAVYKPDKLDN